MSAALLAQYKRIIAYIDLIFMVAALILFLVRTRATRVKHVDAGAAHFTPTYELKNAPSDFNVQV